MRRTSASCEALKRHARLYSKSFVTHEGACLGNWHDPHSCQALKTWHTLSLHSAAWPLPHALRASLCPCPAKQPTCMRSQTRQQLHPCTCACACAQPTCVRSPLASSFSISSCTLFRERRSRGGDALGSPPASGRLLSCSGPLPTPPELELRRNEADAWLVLAFWMSVPVGSASLSSTRRPSTSAHRSCVPRGPQERWECNHTTIRSGRPASGVRAKGPPGEVGVQSHHHPEWTACIRSARPKGPPEDVGGWG